MRLTPVQDRAIAARMALIVGGPTFDYCNEYFQPGNRHGLGFAETVDAKRHNATCAVGQISGLASLHLRVQGVPNVRSIIFGNIGNRKTQRTLQTKLRQDHWRISLFAIYKRGPGTNRLLERFDLHSYHWRYSMA